MAVPIVEFDPFDGRTVVARPVRPDDLVAVGSMLARLSPESARRRFFSPPARPRLHVVRPLVEADHVRHETVVALCGNTAIGIAEYARPTEADRTADVAVVVEDGYQRHGVASFLFRNLARLARRQGIEAFTAAVLAENHAAVSLARSLAPDTALAWEDGGLHLRIPLPARGTAA